MSDDFDFQFDEESFTKALDDFPAQLSENVRQAMLQASVEHDRQIIDAMRSSSGDVPKLAANQSGIRHSFKGELTGSKISDLELRRFSTSPIAAAHEKGATIRPKRAKYLTIPTAAVKTAGGKIRGKIRSFEGHFRKKSGKLTFVSPSGVALFNLVKQVILKPRPFFFKTWNQLEDRRSQQMSDAADKAGERFGS